MAASPRLFDHAERVWREMYAQAIPVAQLTGTDRYLAGMVPPSSLGIWLGALTRLCAGVGLPSTSQYHQVKGVLIRMGTIAQLRRGTAYRVGAWALLARPTEELWEARIGHLGRPARELAARNRHGVDVAAFLERPRARSWRPLPGRRVPAMSGPCRAYWPPCRSNASTSWGCRA